MRERERERDREREREGINMCVEFKLINQIELSIIIIYLIINPYKS